MCFCERIKEARIAAGLTQEQLAKQIGVAKSTLTGYEKGNREPDVFKIKALAKALGVTGDYLLDTEKYNEIKKAPEISLEDKDLDEICNIIKQLPKEQWPEVKGYLKHLLYENEAAQTAKQISDRLA